MGLRENDPGPIPKSFTSCISPFLILSIFRVGIHGAPVPGVPGRWTRPHVPKGGNINEEEGDEHVVYSQYTYLGILSIADFIWDGGMVGWWDEGTGESLP